MRRSRNVGRNARAAWVTRAEAAFLARVPLEEVDRWAESGRVATRRVGASIFVDLAHLREPAPADVPVEARSVRGARARSDRALHDRRPRRRWRRSRPVERPAPRVRSTPRPLTVLGVVAGLTAVALLVLQLSLFGGTHPRPTTDVALSMAAPVTSTPAAIPVGRDPFASPFGAPGKGDESASVLVKPPGVVRDGDAVTAATTVVNQSPDRWLPPSEVTFVARDDTGHVIARTTTTVSLGPGRAQTIVAPDLGVDPGSIAAIEAHIDAARMRERGYREPSVRVADATVTDDGKAIEGTLAVGSGAEPQAALSCAVFDTLDELVAVSTTSVDLSLSDVRGGELRFWLTAQPAKPGPYRVSCSAS
jgi:hypothetical protein